MEEDLEMKIYQMLCSNCPNARKCHEQCETCEEYDEEIRKVEETCQKN